jgi:hypothetical protein
MKGLTARAALASALLLAFCGACGDAPKPAIGSNSFALPTIDSFDSDFWVGSRPADDPVVARVEGTPITASQLEREIALTGPEAKPREILDRMIELELLAREAKNNGYLRPDVISRPRAQALARRVLDYDLAEHTSLADIPADLVAAAYKYALSRYQHFEVFEIVDTQFICCPEENPDACFKDQTDTIQERRVLHAQCFQDIEPIWQALREKLADSQTRQEFRLRAESAFMGEPIPTIQSSYHIEPKVHEYKFQYDVERSYEEQFKKIRYDIFYQAVMDGAKEGWLGAGRKVPYVAKLARSPIGFHILFVDEVIPRINRPIEEPAVQTELRTRLFDQFRSMKFRDKIAGLQKNARLELYTDRLVPLQEAEAKR